MDLYGLSIANLTVASFAATERNQCEPQIHTTTAQLRVELKSMRLASIVTL